MRIYPWIAFLSILVLASIACSAGVPKSSEIQEQIPTLAVSPYDQGRTLYGFFPSPPEVSIQSVIDTYQAIGKHGDVVLLQQEVPWQDFEKDGEAASERIRDIHNQYLLARRNGLDVIFIVDALNGLNRREFYKLPFGWEASFGSERVRSAMRNYTLRILREFRPRYLGLGSEINTYLDAHPEDAENYLSLYREIYAAIKAEAPETQVFVTFQWEDLTNRFGPPNPGKQPGEISWETVEAFEPNLDLWVISTYPFAGFSTAKDIPADYYTPLLERTEKQLAVAEGGYTSRAAGSWQGTPQDQVAYLNALHSQLGPRLTFWIYLILTDFDLESYAKTMRGSGQGGDVETLGLFSAVGLREFDGTPKPALEVWDSYRAP